VGCGGDVIGEGRENTVYNVPNIILMQVPYP
jgi:hypothetical protein